jgi:hypothetical protein
VELNPTPPYVFIAWCLINVVMFLGFNFGIGDRKSVKIVFYFIDSPKTMLLTWIMSPRL